MWAFLTLFNTLLCLGAYLVLRHEGIISWWTLVGLADGLALVASVIAWRFTSLYGKNWGWGGLAVIFTAVAIAATVTVLIG